MARRRVTTVSRLAGGAGAARLRRRKDIGRKKVHFSAKTHATSTRKTFFGGNIFTSMSRGMGIAVRSVFGTGKRVGRKHYRRR